MTGAPPRSAPTRWRGRETDPEAGSGTPAPEGLEAALRAAQAGDRDGFIALYQALQPRLHRYARSLVGQDADDATAEAWLQIARDLPGFAGDVDGFRGWTASITRHRALDMLRADTRRRSDAVGLALPDLADLTAGGSTADAAITALSTAQAVELIATLPQQQAEAVMLRAVVGLSAESAAQVLGKRPGAVRVAAHRGLRTLAQLLERHGAESGRRGTEPIDAAGPQAALPPGTPPAPGRVPPGGAVGPPPPFGHPAPGRGPDGATR